jgi:hypothetical protein
VAELATVGLRRLLGALGDLALVDHDVVVVAHALDFDLAEPDPARLHCGLPGRAGAGRPAGRRSGARKLHLKCSRRRRDAHCHVAEPLRCAPPHDRRYRWTTR